MINVWEHTVYVMAVMISSYYIGKYHGFKSGKLFGIADAIEYFMEHDYFTLEGKLKIRKANEDEQGTSGSNQ